MQFFLENGNQDVIAGCDEAPEEEDSDKRSEL
jgi:hypothetical protein